MKHEIRLAKAIKIEKGKQYLVIFESMREADFTDVDDIKKQIEALGKELGATLKPVVVVDGKVKIAEVEK